MLRRRFLLGSSVLVALLAGIAPHAITPAFANAAIVVNSTADPGDGTCDSTQCTLREAITLANTQSGADEIDFHISGLGIHTIKPASALPAITDTVTIDGFTEGGPSSTSHLIELDGTNAGAGVDGLDVQHQQSLIEGLIIGNFSGDGVKVNASSVTISGNLIGISPLGGAAADIGNGGDGVDIVAGASNHIGGTTATERNVISNNTGHGVSIAGTGTFNGNEVSGNFIGTNIAGTAAAGNGEDGVDIVAGNGNLIGGGPAAAGNVISGNGVGGSFSNGENGIALTGSHVTNTEIENNRIGTDVTGTVAIGNVASGIFTDFSGASGTLIDGNLISGNDVGVLLFSAASSAVRGNRIGTNAAGTASLGTQRIGVGVEGAGVTIGGPGSGNLISGNTDRGIELSGQANDAVIQENLIGTKANGTKPLGNGAEGINVTGAIGTVIGGTFAGAGNVIAANGADGIRVVDGALSTKIQGNFIGTDSTGSAVIGNALDGIDLDGASATTVGGTRQAARNVIRNNGTEGVVVKDTFNTEDDQNRIRQNSIAKNGTTANDLGIDLNADGVTPNDPGDADTGPNDLQNFPVLPSAIQGTTSTAVKTKLHSAASTKFLIDFFSNGACDPSGHGEGAVFLKTVAVTTDSSGNFAGLLTLPRVAKGRLITATATDPSGNTSEFSACRTVT